MDPFQSCTTSARLEYWLGGRAPAASHSSEIYVVRHHIVVIRKLHLEESTRSVLLEDFAVLKFSQVRGESDFPVPTRVMWVA
jgi:hypothetical protein